LRFLATRATRCTYGVKFGVKDTTPRFYYSVPNLALIGQGIGYSSSSKIATSVKFAVFDPIGSHYLRSGGIWRGVVHHRSTPLAKFGHYREGGWFRSVKLETLVNNRGFGGFSPRMGVDIIFMPIRAKFDMEVCTTHANL